MGELIYSGIKALNQEEFSKMKELLTIFNDRVEKSFDSNLYIDVKTHDVNGKADKRRKYVQLSENSYLRYFFASEKIANP